MARRHGNSPALTGRVLHRFPASATPYPASAPCAIPRHCRRSSARAAHEAAAAEWRSKEGELLGEVDSCRSAGADAAGKLQADRDALDSRLKEVGATGLCMPPLARDSANGSVHGRTAQGNCMRIEMLQ